MKNKIGRGALAVLFSVSLHILPIYAFAQNYDIVIMNGRVMDPESKLDAIRNVGISGGTIRKISTKALQGKTVIDAKGMVVAPGLIDLHAHGQDSENYPF